MRREGEGWSFDTPVARGGATAPLSPAGGRQAPLPRPWAGARAGPSGRPRRGRQAPVARWGGDRAFFSSRDLIANLKKKLHLRPVALWGATGGYFWNISKRTYIFEILIFKKYKKEKTADFWFWFWFWFCHKGENGQMGVKPVFFFVEDYYNWSTVLTFEPFLLRNAIHAQSSHTTVLPLTLGTSN